MFDCTRKRFTFLPTYFRYDLDHEDVFPSQFVHRIDTNLLHHHVDDYRSLIVGIRVALEQLDRDDFEQDCYQDPDDNWCFSERKWSTRKRRLAIDTFFNWLASFNVAERRLPNESCRDWGMITFVRCCIRSVGGVCFAISPNLFTKEWRCQSDQQIRLLTFDWEIVLWLILR